MKKYKIDYPFLDELRRVPVVQVACERSNVSRNTVYRWRKEDKKFAEEMDRALAEGVALVNDMSESQLLNLVRQGEFSAISFWLRHRHDAYKAKIEVTTKESSEELSPSQAKIVRNALKLASLATSKSLKKSNKKQIHD